MSKYRMSYKYTRRISQKYNSHQLYYLFSLFLLKKNIFYKNKLVVEYALDIINMNVKYE